MRKALLIALRDIRDTLSDKSLLLLMFAAPLAVATIISATFGGLSDPDSPLDAVPVAVVSHDEGVEGRNLGIRLVRSLTNTGSDSPIRAEEAQEEGVAVERLQRGVLSAVVIVPKDFTKALLGEAAPVRVRVLTYQGRPIAGTIVRSIVQDIVARLAGGAFAVTALVSELPEGVDAGVLFGSRAFQQGMARMQSGDGPAVRVTLQTVRGDQRRFNPLVFFGATQAVFFALFAAQGGATSILEEQRDGTLGRLLVSPTTRMTILLGKLCGTVVMIVVQLTLLFLAFTLVGSLFEGELTLIWGTRYVAIAVTVLATALATAGVGIVAAAAADSPEKASAFGSVLALFMATIGGAFGFVVGPPVSYASVVYWGSRAFSTLAAGGEGIGVEITVMAGFGTVAFMVGLLLFHRRLSN
jgi:ABC-2 type transport system permease protein